MGMGSDQNKKVDDQLPLENTPHTLSDTKSNKLSSDSPDDIDEALAWLEQLAAKQGISVDELTSRYPRSIELSFPELSLSQSDELPEWLKEEPPARRLREFPSSAGETAAIDDVPDWLLSDSPPSAKPTEEKESADLSTELDSRLDWLAEMGKKDELAEMPTVRWRPEDAGLADSGVPSSVDLGGLDDAEKSGQIPSPDMADLRSNGPEDLDEAMAWLEELATSQETPLQELPSVADRILASRLMAESGMDLDDLSHDALDTPHHIPDEPLFAATFSDEAFNESAEQPIELTNFPDNLDDAMDYLDKLAAARQKAAPSIIEEAASTEEAKEEAQLTAEMMAVAISAEMVTAEETEEAEDSEEADETEDTIEETAVEPVDEVDSFLAEMLEPVEADTGDVVGAVDAVDEVDLEEGITPATPDIVTVAEELQSDAVGEQEAKIDDGRFDEDILTDVDGVDEADDDTFRAGNLLIFTTDRLESTLNNLDQLSLPPGITLQSLNEGFTDNDLQQINGNGHHDDLNSALLWLEQQLDASPEDRETAGMPDTSETYEEPDELLLSVAALDDELVADLTADMPENPDEALVWLLGLTDEIESDSLNMDEAADDAADEDETVVDTSGETLTTLSSEPQDVQIDDMPEPLSLEESLVSDQAEELPEYEPRGAELERPELSAPQPPQAILTEELPEMPDDPDEAIAWIERLAALETQENGNPVRRDTDDDVYFDNIDDIDDIADENNEAEDAFDDAVAQVEEEAADYSGYEVESSVVVEGVDEADEANDEPEATEQAETVAPQPQQTKQAHERWLDQLQPPSWTKKEKKHN